MQPSRWRSLAPLSLATLLSRRRRRGRRGEIHLPPGFRAELVYAVPLDTQGSWVSLTVDDRGRLIACDQNGALYRIEPSPARRRSDADQGREDPDDRRHGPGAAVPSTANCTSCMNGQHRRASARACTGSATRDNDDQFDRIEQLRVFNGDGEHGPHAVVLGPDGKSLYFVLRQLHGAAAATTARSCRRGGAKTNSCRGSPTRMGHANDIKAPGGWIARTDLDGNNLELVSVGYRNMYDIAFNADGELFTFDSDMEWDIGTPWYRPTRVCHVDQRQRLRLARRQRRCGRRTSPTRCRRWSTSGPGSPTGLTFGAGTKFPPQYQQALFGGDWSYGNIYAIHLTPEGSSYRGEVERFASAMPLGVTDMVVRPQDGALYFAVGGRQSESALYRIVWTGEAVEDRASEPAADAERRRRRRPRRRSPPRRRRPANCATRSRSSTPARSRRAVDEAWPHLGNPDRFVRYAARWPSSTSRSPSGASARWPRPNVDARLTALVGAGSHRAIADEQAEWADAITAISLRRADRAAAARTCCAPRRWA